MSIMQIFVKTLEGQTYTVNIDQQSGNVDKIKEEVSKQSGKPVEAIRLIFAGCELNSTMNGVQAQSTMYVVYRRNQKFSEKRVLTGADIDNYNVVQNLSWDIVSPKLPKNIDYSSCVKDWIKEE
jgi:hypothetical protein